MAINYSAEKHTRAELGNLIAQDYGRHTASVNITDNTDNGRIIKVGEMEGLDNYKMEAVTTIDAYIAQKGVNGLYLVVINEVKDARTALIYTKPQTNVESPKALTLESNFYNDPADGPVRAYLLDSLDRFWLSEEGFEGTPAVGSKITTIKNGKPVIA